MAEVFLSYKREDSPAASMVAKALEQGGLSVFFDLKIPVGDKWDAAIERELLQAKAVVVLWSPRSRESEWVRREARDAQRRSILCPALIEQCDPPLEFSDIQHADLREWLGGQATSDGWKRLMLRVRQCLDQADAEALIARQASAKYVPFSQRLELRHESAVNGACFSRSNDRIATVSGRIIGFGEKAARVWDARSGRLISKMSLRRTGYAVSFTPDGTQILTSDFGHPSLQLWGANDGRLITTLYESPKRQNIIHSIEFSPNGNFFVFGETDQAVFADEGAIKACAEIWDFRTKKVSKKLWGHKWGVECAVFSGDGRRVLTAGHSESVVKIWDAETGELQLSIQCGDAVRWAEFSPDLRTVLVTGGGETALFDALTGTKRLRFPFHRAAEQATFSPDGALVAIGNSDDGGRLYMYSAIDGSLLQKLGPETKEIKEVHTVRFSSDGHSVLFGGDNNLLRVWSRS